ncbi:MAG: RIP metalloprotease RseP [Candidatus Pacebacteria bacterium]|nr:RIP metalloprotease RseP [Candidatus Paceibacterota bacterium]
MAIIFFLIIIAVLVFVHELGHFLVAKWQGIRVDEFAIGFPPKVWSFKKGETVYAINLIPFGGYVKIFGENPDEESLTGPDSQRSMVNKSKWSQVLVLIAGVSCNVIFAWLLISFSLMSGMPTSAGFASGYSSSTISHTQVIVTGVIKGGPAEKAGLKTGNIIVGLNAATSTLSVSSIQQAVAESQGKPVILNVLDKTSASESRAVQVIPEKGVISADTYAIGLGMDTVGIVKFGFLQSFYEGAKTTGIIIKETTVGLAKFIAQAFTGQAHLSQVSGPVGIVGMVGQASQYGWAYLISFTAFISINLAVINILPFPALDGGRILFIIIESIKGSRLSPKIANTANAIGFGLLLLLMLVVTLSDVVKLFH